jgi:hypothetical protein
MKICHHLATLSEQRRQRGLCLFAWLCSRDDFWESSTVFFRRISAPKFQDGLEKNKTF